MRSGFPMARILACGAFLKNAACVWDSTTPHAAQWSPNHGDLSDPEACRALEASVVQLLDAGEIGAVAHDLHPDFFSTHLAQRIAHERAIPAIPVQHHHAHIATVLAEHGALHNDSKPVIGLALDGVGLGTDGTAWGGEVLLVDGAQCQRLGFLTPLHLPGGDKAAIEPWRMAAAAWYACGMGERIANPTIRTMLERGLNCPTTTAAGRWFDAVAGLLGLCERQSFEAEAAIALEKAAAHHLQHHRVEVDPRHWHIHPHGAKASEIDLRPLLLACIFPVDVSKPEAVNEAAARFHLTLADALSTHTKASATAQGVDTVALGGGCFFNRILKERIVERLEAAGLTVLQTKSLSCGDAGLALGQAWVAERALTASASVMGVGSQYHREAPAGSPNGRVNLCSDPQCAGRCR